MTTAVFNAQARLDFEIDHLLGMGINTAYVTPFARNNESFSKPQEILTNLELLKEKAEKSQTKGLDVYPLFVTVGHPEGNFSLPKRYRMQQNLDGSIRPGTICFKDSMRQSELFQFVEKAASLGFKRMAFDDDLRDAFCYCDQHIYGFAPFADMTRPEISNILNDVSQSDKHEDIRRKWYGYKFEEMKKYALIIESKIHKISPLSRIGIFNSAKRCHDFSGRDPLQWAKLFHTEKAPVFIRLCGECYHDTNAGLVQSGGWHSYFNYSYPPELDRMLEITSVPSVSYRSPGTVLFEASLVSTLTNSKNILWAWTEEFKGTGLDESVRPFYDKLNEDTPVNTHQETSQLAVYIGHQLGPYTPQNVSVDYGTSHDPLAAYNITALAGLPVKVLDQIPPKQEVVLCSSYISREMAENIDDYIFAGGVCLLDAIAAGNYRVYGGTVPFKITGPVSPLSYESVPKDQSKQYLIAHCDPQSTYCISDCQYESAWTAYDSDNNIKGLTTVIIPHGKGKLVVIGYDFSTASNVLICYQWRKRLLSLLSLSGVDIHTYWSGIPAVQLVNYSQKIAVINYNTNKISGEIVAAHKKIPINIDTRSVKLIDLNITK